MKRSVVITGASRGLGLALVKKFLARGDRVFGISKTSRSWQRAAAELPKSSGMTWVRADLTREADVVRVVRQIRRRAGKVHILVNNAGVGGKVVRTEQESLRALKTMMEGNLYSAFLMCKHWVPVFRRQETGLIINISSMAGQRAVPRLFSYSASKFGVLALSQCVAKENPDKNLKCLTVCPGGMNTGMRVSLFGAEDAARQQSADFVAGIIMEVAAGKIPVESGGDIVIRHGKITAIHASPAA